MVDHQHQERFEKKTDDFIMSLSLTSHQMKKSFHYRFLLMLNLKEVRSVNHLSWLLFSGFREHVSG